MKRLSIFAKGNLDLRDSLHSCRVGGTLVWNGINEILRERYDALARLKHETCTPSNALLAADGIIPAVLAERSLPLDSYPPASQFSRALFDATADVIILSVQPDIAAEMVRHRREGFLFHPYSSRTWPAADRAWLTAEFLAEPQLDAAASMSNFEGIIARLRERSDAPILIYNMSPIVPGEVVHCFQGLGETFSTRVRRYNAALVDLSERTGISIIDVDTIIARAGADAYKLDMLHLTPPGYRLVAEEVVRVIDDLGLL